MIRGPRSGEPYSFIDRVIVLLDGRDISDQTSAVDPETGYLRMFKSFHGLEETFTRVDPKRLRIVGRGNG